jgi:dihydroorotate dehydrogenase electron transfer subunit
MNPLEHKISEIKEKKIYKKNFCLLAIKNNFHYTALPGQFIHVKTEDVFLRRPFSIAKYSDKNLSVLFQIKGKGTFSLSRKNPGEKIDIIGPVGNSFPYEKFKGDIVIAAGGIGISPMIFLASVLIKNKKKFSFFYGARNKDLLLDIFLPSGKYPAVVSTDDGSKGEKGKITDKIKDYIKTGKIDAIFASGPYFMLKTISEIAQNANIPCYVSMENRMFCGTGVCQGCVIETAEGFKKVCTEGPIFDAKQIKWKETTYL